MVLLQGFFDSIKVGEIMSRFITDANEIETRLTQSICDAVGSITLIVGGTVLLFTISWVSSMMIQTEKLETNNVQYCSGSCSWSYCIYSTENSGQIDNERTRRIQVFFTFKCNYGVA